MHTLRELYNKGAVNIIYNIILT